MQITLSAQQSQILEQLSQRGGYASLTDAIDAALVLLADEIAQQQPDETPDYLAWVEQTRLKIEEAIQAVEQGAVLNADDVVAGLRQKVSAAKAASA
jgi:Arc/MetJ-type ribon-helix-helix transcriptional regulator